MKQKNKIIIGCILGVIIITSSIFIYKKIKVKKLFNIKQITWSGEQKEWNDNSRNNLYDIKFGELSGSDTKEVITLKDDFEMNIDSKVEGDDFTLKIYTNENILYLSNNNVIKDVIEISKEKNNDIKIEISGEKAKGHVKIKFK